MTQFLKVFKTSSSKLVEMDFVKSDRLTIHNHTDIVLARKKVREWSLELGFGVVDQTKIVTAASELARNTFQHGGGGEMEIAFITNATQRPGLRLIFEDHGPGIANINLALTDGYTTGGGMGLGLSGSKRLMSEFNLESEVGKGTRVTIIKWK